MDKCEFRNVEVIDGFFLEWHIFMNRIRDI